MAKRTYYAVEFHTPSYPVNELIVQTRRFADPQTQAQAHTVRAESRDEAERLLRDRLNSERAASL